MFEQLLQDQTKSKLEQIQAYLAQQKAFFLEATETVVSEGVSNYPIVMVYHEASLEVGLPLRVVETESEKPWIFRLTTLEELVVKKIVPIEKVDAFRKTYKEKTAHWCVFHLDQESQWLFVPQ